MTLGYSSTGYRTGRVSHCVACQRTTRRSYVGGSETEPFPSGNYTAVEIHLAVRQATRSGGDDITYGGESPVINELGSPFEGYMTIAADATTTLTVSINPSIGFDGEEFIFASGYSKSSQG